MVIPGRQCQRKLHLQIRNVTMDIGLLLLLQKQLSGGRQHSIEFNCVTNFVSPETYGIVNDSDGVSNQLDLDSDNHGIYDAVEAAHVRAPSNVIINGTYGDNGIADDSRNCGGELCYQLIQYRMADATDPPDFLDTDSDDDRCSDCR